MHRIAIHGFRIVETREGQRIEHFRRTARTYDLVRARVFDLLRDRRYRDLPVRRFEIWDGINAVSVITVDSMGIHDNPFLLPTRADYLDRDAYYANRNKIKKQQIGASRGDITSWVKQAPLDKVLCRKILPEKQEISSRKVSRSLARCETTPDRLKECFTPGKKQSDEWLVRHNLMNPEQFK